MRVLPAAVKGPTGSGVVIGDSDLLPRHAVFRTRDLDEARGHLCGVFAEHRVNYLPRERHLEFRHRQAKLGSIALNSLEWGAGVMVTAPLLPDFYLLQFTLTGACELWQGTHHSVLPARSVTIVNPGRAFRKAWMPRTRQLLLRIDRRLVERELRAWTGGNEVGAVEFGVPPVEDLDTVGSLALFVRMVCEDLKNEASDLSHPLVADRVASGLVALLLTSMPHNKQRAIEAVNQPTAPFFVRRVEEFIQEHARDPITLADLTGIAGVSTRALQTSFRRFRNTTPMAHLRALRLELARIELTSARRQGLSVAAVASALGFGHLGRFARDYQLRFGELPWETVYRGGVGCSS
jgi:AraC-like DNA-binding protein